MKKYLSLENLIYLTIFLLPTYLLKINIYFFRTNFLEILILANILSWMFFFKKKHIFSWVKYKKYIFGVGLMLAGLFLSAIINKNILQSLNIIRSWFLLPLFFMLIAGDVLSKEKIKNIFTAYACSTFFVAVISLGYLVLRRLTYDNRLEAFYNSPNYLAMYIVPGLLICFWASIYLKEEKQAMENNTDIKECFFQIFLFNSRRRNIIGSLFLLVVLFFTSSYAAFTAAFIGGLIILSPKKKFLRYSLLLGIIFLIFFSFQLNSPKFKKLIELDGRSSMASRGIIWRSAWRIGEDRAITGIGAANFQDDYLVYQRFFPPYLEWAVPHPQNIYLNLWLSGGILSIVGFFWLIFVFLRDLIRKKNQDKLAILVLGIMVYILFHGLFDSTYFKNDLAIFFWLNFLVLKGYLV